MLQPEKSALEANERKGREEPGTFLLFSEKQTDGHTR